MTARFDQLIDDPRHAGSGIVVLRDCGHAGGARRRRSDFSFKPGGIGSGSGSRAPAAVVMQKRSR
ncbi:MAG: hypothetical protein WAL22_12205 [Solirubrobacteraceae bacterium]